MSRGQTWSKEEVQALISIWSEDYMSRLLVTTHKNREVFKLFSQKMAEYGFNRSMGQCRIKVKKLRQQYVKVRKLRKSGSSLEEHEKFVWYDNLDGILGTRLPGSIKQEPPWSSTPAEPAALFQCSRSLEPDCNVNRSCGEVHPEEDESTTSSGSPRPQLKQNTLRWANPSAQNRKKKRWTDRLDSFLETYMQQKREMDESDQRWHSAFENFIRLQQEAEERRFKAMQEQQQANSQLLLHMIGILSKALLPQSQTSQAQHIPTTLKMSPYAWPHHNSTAATTNPQETSEYPVAPITSYLPETVAPRTSSSVIHDAKVDLLKKEEQDLMKEIQKIQAEIKEEEDQNLCLREEADVFRSMPEKKLVFQGLTGDADDWQKFDMKSDITYPMDGGTALITFEEEDVASSILEMKKHKVDLGGEFRIFVEAQPVNLMLPSQVEIDSKVCTRRILVSNLPKMDTETLLNKLEIHFSKTKNGGGEVDVCDFLPDSGTVVVTFVEENIAKRLVEIEFHEVKLTQTYHKVRVTPFLNGKITNLETKMTMCPRTVLLTGIPDVMERETLQDLLEIHFQKNSNGGGEIEAFLYNPVGQNTLALFGNTSSEERDEE